MFFFTADEHYDHAKILEYCDRPFKDVEEMNEALIAKHNLVVNPRDITVHAGDFGWFKKKADAQKIIKRLHGNHIFIKGDIDDQTDEDLHGQFPVQYNPGSRQSPMVVHF